ncbi:stalk domain-containing protein [Paenibacillus alkalitolerans]|uniref:stalk domain-containing protein n=1 Tax=Paenibacillus alkalitolerans TaxID=2799335 RepID=UPI0018F7CBDE|nr:stalk domain-containing protein [Paenibacillus alkalitolerans]
MSSKFRFLSVLLVMALALGIFPVTSAAASSIKVVKDGTTLSFDENPQVINGRTFVPYRKLAEEIGAKVSWDDASDKVTVTKGTKTAVLTIGSKTAAVNGKSVTLDAAPITKNGRTLVPLRFISESLGLWVSWNGTSKTVAIESKKTIKHEMGTVTLNGAPERVVVLFNGMVDIALTLGVKPVGAVESWVEKPWYHYIRSEMTGVKNLGAETQPNIEAIVALKPDLIIGSKLRHEKIYGQLSKIAPTIMTESVFDWKEHIKLAGVALNKEENANQFLQDWNARVAEFKQKMGSKAKSTEVSVIRFQPDGIARIYVSGFAGTILEEVGLSRPKAQQVEGKVVVDLSSKEQIPMLDGDVIFDITSSWGNNEGFKTAEDWTSSPLWKNLKGVKNAKFYDVNDITWNMSGGARAAKMMLDDLFFYFDLE